MNRCLTVAACAAALAACETSPSQGWEGETTDSAGVTIVHNHTTPGVAPWNTVVDRTIGAESGDPNYIFGRIADVTTDTDGRTLVLDQHAHTVRIYDAVGTFVRDVGREGRGPGEFSAFANAVLTDSTGTFYVADYPNARISAFQPSGDLARTIGVPPVPNGHSWAWSTTGFFFRGMTISRNAENRFEFWDAILHVGPDGGGLDTVVVFDYARTDIGGPGNIRVPLIVNSPFWDVLPGDRLIWGATDRAEVYVHDSTGTLVRIIRHAEWTHAAITASDHETMRELLRGKLRMLGGASEAADGPNVESGDVLPAITSVQAGPDDTIWVQRMGPVDTIDPWGINAPNRAEWLGGQVWDVLNADGRALGTLTMPPRFRVMRVTDAAVIGIQKDALDVERVVRLRLEPRVE